jgi:hypothetical protein
MITGVRIADLGDPQRPVSRSLHIQLEDLQDAIRLRWGAPDRVLKPSS